MLPGDEARRHPEGAQTLCGHEPRPRGELHARGRGGGLGQAGEEGADIEVGDYPPGGTSIFRH